MTMRHVCSQKHQYTSDKMMYIEETAYGVLLSLYQKLGTRQETALDSAIDSMLSKGLLNFAKTK